MLGFVIGVVAIVFGTISLKKHQAKGFSITGVVLGAIATLVSIAMTIVLIVGLANWNDDVPAPSAAIEESAPTAESLTAEELSQFTDVDDATLAQIIDNPASFDGEMLIIYGSMGEPLVATGPDGEYMCVMKFSPSATEEENPDVNPFEIRAAGVGGGTLDECPMLDAFVTPNPAALSAKKKMWVIVSGQGMPVEGSDGETERIVLFGVVKTE